jgi:hypothetical protein
MVQIPPTDWAVKVTLKRLSIVPSVALNPATSRPFRLTLTLGILYKIKGKITIRKISSKNKRLARLKEKA